MKKGMTLVGAVFLALTLPAFAGDPGLGRAKAIKCKQCHGLDGIGMLPNYPNLGGQKEDYLVAQLRAFRDGSRENQMMSFVAQSLNDEDIANLAAYYASIKVEITLPE